MARFDLADLAQRNYPTKFHIMDRSVHIATEDTLQEALAHAAKLRQGYNLKVKVVQYAPDGSPTVTSRWPGGTWSGTCGATRWFDTNETGGAAITQRRTASELVALTQAWFLRSNRIARSERFPVPTIGFRVECDAPYRHEGPCSTGMFTWPDQKLRVAQEGNVNTRQVNAA